MDLNKMICDRGIFECYITDFHEKNCNYNNCSNITCHKCPKKCSKCNKQAEFHVLELQGSRNVCDEHNPWNDFYSELSTELEPHVFNLKTKRMLPKTYSWEKN
jgi:hypothetical protein